MAPTFDTDNVWVLETDTVPTHPTLPFTPWDVAACTDDTFSYYIKVYDTPDLVTPVTHLNEVLNVLDPLNPSI